MPIELGFILHAARRDGRGGPVAARRASRGRPPTRRTTRWLGEVDHQALPRRRQRREGADGRHPAGLRRAERRATTRRAADAFLRERHAPDARPRLPRVRLRPDDRAAALPRGQRVHQLHRLRRRPRLHAARHRGASTASRPSASSAARTRSRYADDEHGGTVSTRRRRTSSTTGPRSRCGSGAGSVGARSSPAATRTATSRCSTTPAGRTARRSGCSSCTTTRSVSSPTRPGAEKSLDQAARPGLDGRQHQERLGDGLQQLGSLRAFRRHSSGISRRPIATRGLRAVDLAIDLLPRREGSAEAQRACLSQVDALVRALREPRECPRVPACDSRFTS